MQIDALLQDDAHGAYDVDSNVIFAQCYLREVEAMELDDVLP